MQPRKSKTLQITLSTYAKQKLASLDPEKKDDGKAVSFLLEEIFGKENLKGNAKVIHDKIKASKEYKFIRGNVFKSI